MSRDVLLLAKLTCSLNTTFEKFFETDWSLACHNELLFEEMTMIDLVYEFHETCHSVTFYFMKKRLQTMCDTKTPESIHTKDESKRGIAFAFIFGVNWPVQWMQRNDKFQSQQTKSSQFNSHLKWNWTKIPLWLVTFLYKWSM